MSVSKYPNKAGIYKLTCINNGKIYIGKSTNLRRRLNSHKNSPNKLIDKYFLQNAIAKYGWDSFNVDILEIVENFDKLKDNDALLKREEFYIELFDSTNKDRGYNLCKSSCDRTGLILSEETKIKMKQSRVGRILSDEHKKNIGNASRGRLHSKETKDKMSESRLGKKQSEETKEKRRLSSIGRLHSDETKEKMRKPKSDEFKEKMRNRKHTEDSKEKIRQAKLGKPLPEEHKEKIRQAKLGKPRRIKNNV